MRQQILSCNLGTLQLRLQVFKANCTMAIGSVGKVVCFSIFFNLEILFFQIYHCKELSFLFSKLERMITKHDDAKCVNKALCCMQSGFEVK